MSYTFEDLHWAKHISVEDYLLPQSLEEALDMLAEYKGRARVVAGGTDVIPQLRRKDLEVEVLVDITRLKGMGTIDEDGSKITLGGLVTHAQVASSPLIKEKARLLAEGGGWVGSPQIRNIATVAGNLVSGQPAADTSIPLLALNASVAIATKGAERRVPLSEFFLDTAKTVLDPTKEILTRIQFNPLKENQGGCYLRLSKRKALALPMLVCAIVVKVDPTKKVFEEAAIALGPVAPTPFRAARTEAQLRDAPISEDTLRVAAETARLESSPRDSCLRGSCDYRQEMVEVFVRRGLRKALERAGYPVD
ncbi:MAG TPA: FAD binding domain-containing protein [Acidobacteriota bacterium]|nr:FAD binding domain-containing protein [Acidobacteriota bacterium]